MHVLILTALVVFFGWQAGLRDLAGAACARLPDELAGTVQYAVVAVAAWQAPRLPTWIFQAMAVGGAVALANVAAKALRAYAQGAGPAVTLRPGARMPGIH